jgi:hypothetical protein
VAALLDGDIILLRSHDGAMLNRQPHMPDGYASVVYSVDVDDARIAFGAIDGRCGLIPLSHFATALFGS